MHVILMGGPHDIWIVQMIPMIVFETAYKNSMDLLSFVIQILYDGMVS